MGDVLTANEVCCNSVVNMYDFTLLFEIIKLDEEGFFFMLTSQGVFFHHRDAY